MALQLRIQCSSEFTSNNKQLENKDGNFQPLVEYNSCIKSVYLDDIHVPIRYSTAWSLRSGLQVQHIQHQTTLTSSPSHISDIECNLSLTQKMLDTSNLMKKIISLFFTPKMNQNDSFNDDMPLSELKSDKNNLICKSFNEFCPTHDYAQTKAKPDEKL